MNKHFYKVIFNRTINRLVVVSEIAKAKGKAVTEGIRKWFNTTFSSMQVSLNTLTFSLFCALGFVSFSESTLADTLVIRADQNAPKHQQPIILKTANHLPQVNIQTPNEKGLSHNKYQQFDVDTKGAILNNSRKNSQTQQAGWVQGNPYLAKGEAKVILNEVTSSNPSRLKGYVEVAGKKADIIIANPSGIHCEGCGIINADKATLTTGKPKVVNGHLEAFIVERGKITVSEKGLNNHQVNYTDIIAREVEAKGNIVSQKKVSVIAGKNTVKPRVSDENLEIIQRQEESSISDKPKVAIDVGKLGGMYAEKIYLIGTESGVGVNHQGHLGASADNVIIDSKGRIVNAGSISSEKQIQLQSRQGSIDNKSGSRLQATQGVTLNAAENITLDGTLVALGDKHQKSAVAIQAGKQLSVSGEVLASGKLNYNATQVNTKENSVSAAGVEFNTDKHHQSELTLANQSSQGQDIVINTSVAKLQGRHLATKGLVVNALDVNMDKSESAGYQIDITAKNTGLMINSAKLTALDQLRLSTPQRLSTQNSHLRANQLLISAQEINNLKGTWEQEGNNDLWFNVNSFNNKQGKMSSGGNISFFSPAFTNTEGTILSDGNIDINTQTNTFNTARGKLISQQSVRIHSGKLINQDGLIQATNDLLIDTHQQDLDNSQTSRDEKASSEKGIISQGQLTLQTKDLKNQQGYLYSLGRNDINATHIDNTKGVLQGDRALSLNAQTLTNNQGKLVSNRELSLNISNTITQIQGIIQSGEFTLNTVNFSNKASQITANNIHITTSGEVDNRQGKLFAQNNITLINHQLKNHQGEIIAKAGNIALNSQSNIDNEAGVIFAEKALTINAAQLNNKQGNIQSNQTLQLQTNVSGIVNDSGHIISQHNMTLLTQKLMNQLGEISANHSVTISSAQFNNAQGKVQAQNHINVDTGTQSIKNEAGQIVAQQGSLTVNSGKLNSQGGRLQAKQGIAIDTHQQTLINREKGHILSEQGQVAIKSGTVDNAAGHIQAHRNLSLESDKSVVNNQQGSLLSEQGSLTVNSGKLNNQGGRLQAKQGITIDTHQQNLINREKGHILSEQGQVTIKSGAVDNAAGHIQAHRNLSLESDKSAVDNQQGSLLSEQGSLTVNSGKLNSQGGRLQAKQGIAIDTHQQTLINREKGHILSEQGQVAIKSGAVDNEAGHIQAHRNLSLESDKSAVNNQQGSLLSEQGSLTVNSGKLNNQGGRLQAKQGIAIDTHQQTLINREKGHILSEQGQVAIKSGAVDNEAGHIQAQLDLELNTHQQKIKNKEGNILSTQGNLTAVKSAEIDNRQGYLQGKQFVSLNTGGQQLNNDAGHILSQQNNIHIHSGKLNNHQGEIKAQQNITIQTNHQSVDNQQGNMSALAGSAVLLVGELNNTKGTLSANQGLTVDTHQQKLNNTEGHILSYNGSLSLAAKAIHNVKGEIIAQDQLSLNTNSQHFNNTEGKLISKAGGLTLNTHQIQNHQGVIEVAKDLHIDTHSNEFSSDEGSISSHQGSIYITSGKLTNKAGKIQAKQHLNLTISGQPIDNTKGTLFAETGWLNITAANLHNSFGVIQAAKQLSVNVAETDNQSGKLLSQQDNITFYSHRLNNTLGHIDAQKSIYLTTKGQSFYNDQGSVFAKQGTLTLRTGQIEGNNSTLQAAGDIDIVAQGALLQRANSTILSQQGNVRIHSGVLENSHSLIDGQQNITINTTQQTLTNQQNATIVAHQGTLSLMTGEMVNQNSLITSAQQLNITTQQKNVQNDKGHIISKAGAIHLATGAFSSNNGKVEANKAIVLNTSNGTLSNQLGHFISKTAGLDFQVGELDNQSGLLQAEKAIKLQTQQLNNQNKGKILTNESINITATGLNNHNESIIQAIAHINLSTQGGFVNNSQNSHILSKAGDIHLIAGNIDNHQNGTIYAQQSIKLNNTSPAVHWVNNSLGFIQAIEGAIEMNTGAITSQQGVIKAKQAITLNSHQQQLDNTKGTIQSENAQVDLTTGKLINHNGTIKAQDNLTIKTNNHSLVNTQRGVLSSNASISLITGEINNNGGTIQGKNNIDIDTNKQTLINRNTGNIVAETGSLILRTGELVNDQGLIQANQSMVDINTHQQAFSNKAGKLISGEHLVLKSAEIHNQEGEISAAQKLDIDSGHSLINNSNGSILGLTSLVLQSGKLINTHKGLIQAQGQFSLNTSGQFLDNTEGRLLTNASFSGVTGQVLNRQGVIQAAEALDLNSNQKGIDNQQGKIKSLQANLNLLNTGEVINTHKGEIYAKNHINLNTAGHRVNNNGGAVVANQGMVIANSGEWQNNQQGVIEAQQDIRLNTTTQKLSNNQGVIKSFTGAIHLTTGEVDNRKGVIQAEQWLLMNSTQQKVDNSNGTLLSKNNNITLLTGELINQQEGIIQAEKSLNITTTKQVNNNDGLMLAKQGQLTVSAGELLNNKGTVQAAQQLNLTTSAKVENKAGKIISQQGGVELTTGAFSNQNGRVQSHQQLNMTTRQQILDNFNGVILSNAGMNLTQIGTINNVNGTIQAKNALALTMVNHTKLDNSHNGTLQSLNSTVDLITGEVINQNGTIKASGGGLSLNSQGNRVNNNQGNIISNGLLKLTVGEFTNHQGNVSAKNDIIAISSKAFSNQKGTLIGQNITFNVVTLDNSQGTVKAHKQLSLTTQNVTHSLKNDDGKLISEQAMHLTTGEVSNHNGSIQSNSTLVVHTQGQKFSNTNNATLIGNQSLNLTTGELLNDNSTISTNGTLTLTTSKQRFTNKAEGKVIGVKGLNASTGTFINDNGTLSTNGTLTLNTSNQSFTNKAQGKVISVKGLNASTGTFINDNGTLSTNGTLTLTTSKQSFTNKAQGELIGGAGLNVSTGTFINDNGTLSTNGTLSLTTSNQSFTNKAQGELIGGAGLNASTGTFINDNGTLSTNGTLTLTTSNQSFTNKAEGKLIGKAGLNVSTGAFINDNSALSTNGTLTLTTSKQNFTNQAQGKLIGVKGLNVSTGTFINDNGTLSTNGTLTLTTSNQSFTNKAEGKVIGGAGLNVSTGTFINDNGALSTNGTLTLTTSNQSFTNKAQGKVIGGSGLNVSTGAFVNDNGTLSTNGTLTLTTSKQNFTNQAQGKLIGLAGMNLQIGNMTNVDSHIYTEGNLTLNTHQGDFKNVKTASNDSTITSFGAMNLTTGNAENQGKIQSQGKIDFQAKEVKNDTGLIAGEAIRITAKQLSNNQTYVSNITKQKDLGIIAKEQLDLITDQLLNNKGYIQGKNILINASNISQSAGAIQASHQFNLTTKLLNSTQGSLLSMAEGVFNVSQALSNEHSTLLATKNLTLKGQSNAVARVNNTQGIISALGELNLHTGEFNNTQGLVQSKGALTLNTSGQNLINRDTFDSTDAKKLNEKGIFSNESIRLNTGAIDNQKGNIHSSGRINIEATGSVNNLGGRLYSKNQHFTLNTTGDVNNQGGEIAAHGITLSLVNLTSNQQGRISSAGNLTLKGVNNTSAIVVNNHQGILAANGDVRVKASELINNKEGKIYSSEQSLYLDTSKLDNRQGNLIAVEGNLTVNQSHFVDNRLGYIFAGKSLAFNMARSSGVSQWINQGGQLLAKENLTLNGNQTNVRNEAILHNGTQVEGKIIALGNVSLLNVAELNNRGGYIESLEQSVKMNANQVDNRQAGSTGSFIQGNQRVDINVGSGEIMNQGTVAAATKAVPDQGIAGGEVILTAGVLNNTQGGIYSRGEADLSIGSQLLNQQGEMLSLGRLTIAAANGKIDNKAGKIASNTYLNIHSQHLTSDGVLLSPETYLKMRENFTVSHQIHAEKHLEIETQGVLTNNQQLHTEGRLVINANEINNQANGTIKGYDTYITARTGNITNRGVITSQLPKDKTGGTGKDERLSKTVLNAKEWIINTGTGQIYGDVVALGAKQVINQDEDKLSADYLANSTVNNTTTNGTNTTTNSTTNSTTNTTNSTANVTDFASGVIAARHLLYIGANKIDNLTRDKEATEESKSMLYSGGDIFLGKTLEKTDTVSGFKVTGQGANLTNSAALIDAMGNISLNMAGVDNLNPYFEEKILPVPVSELDPYGGEKRSLNTTSSYKAGEADPDGVHFIIPKMWTNENEKEWRPNEGTSVAHRISKADLKWASYSRAGQYVYKMGNEGTGIEPVIIRDDDPVSKITKSTLLLMPNSMTCSDANQQSCTPIEGSSYGVNNPIWTYFAAQTGGAPTPPPAVDETERLAYEQQREAKLLAIMNDIAQEEAKETLDTKRLDALEAKYDAEARRLPPLPVKPAALEPKGTGESEAAYQARVQAYQRAQTAYESALSLYRYAQWQLSVEDKYHQLALAIEAHNQALGRQEFRQYWDIRLTDREIKETQTVKTLPGVIRAGGNITVDTQQFMNNRSRVIAGGALLGNFKERFVNWDTEKLRKVTEWGDKKYSYSKWRGSHRRYFERRENQQGRFEVTNTTVLTHRESAQGSFFAEVINKNHANNTVSSKTDIKVGNRLTVSEVVFGTNTVRNAQEERYTKEKSTDKGGYQVGQANVSVSYNDKQGINAGTSQDKISLSAQGDMREQQGHHFAGNRTYLRREGQQGENAQAGQGSQALGALGWQGSAGVQGNFTHNAVGSQTRVEAGLVGDKGYFGEHSRTSMSEANGLQGAGGLGQTVSFMVYQRGADGKGIDFTKSSLQPFRYAGFRQGATGVEANWVRADVSNNANTNNANNNINGINGNKGINANSNTLIGTGFSTGLAGSRNFALGEEGVAGQQGRAGNTSLMQGQLGILGTQGSRTRLSAYSFNAYTTLAEVERRVAGANAALKTNQGETPWLSPVQVRSVPASTDLPRLSLYRLNPSSSSPYLVETNPEFTQEKRWLSSDYFFNQLGYRPDLLQKRLGDGYYEQQQVQAQINQLTGSYSLITQAGEKSAVNFNEEYKALMTNGASFAKAFNLTPGVKLSAAQIARLTQDIVWFESATVNLPNGEKSEVLVPKVYALARPDDVSGSGALFSGNEVRLTGGQGSQLSNDGSIFGRQLVSMKAGHFTNRGLVDGEVISSHTDSLTHQGEMSAGRLLILNVKDKAKIASTRVTDKTAATQTDYIDENVKVGRRATLTVRGTGTGNNANNHAGNSDNPDTSVRAGLFVQAGELSLTGALIDNQGTGATVLRGEKGISLESLNIHHCTTMGSGKHQRTSETQDAVVTQIKGKGDVLVQSNGSLSSQGAEIKAGKNLSLIAKEDLYLGTAQTGTSVKEYHEDSSGSKVSRKKIAEYDKKQNKHQIGTHLEGESVRVVAGNDINAQALTALSEGDMVFQAGNNVTIRPGEDYHQEESWKKRSRTGVFGGGGIGVTFGKASEYHQGKQEGWLQSTALSTLGSTEGNIHITAGNAAQISGTELIANKDKDIVVTGKTLTIDTGVDRFVSEENHEYKQGGLTLALTVPAVEGAVSAVNSFNQARRASQNGETNKKLTALRQIKAAQEAAAALNNAQALANTVGHMVNGNLTENPNAVQNPSIKVSISVGGSQSKQRSQQESTQHFGSQLTAGNTTLTTTAGDLAITGSTVNADRIDLNSAGEIQLTSAQDSHQSHTNSKNSGWNVGVFVGYNGNSYGIGIEANGQVGKGKENSSSITQVNTQLNGQKVSIQSQGDTRLQGAEVNAQRLEGDIKGNLLIESRQDESHYAATQTQAGASVAVTYGGGGGASASFAKNSAKANQAQVGTQSGFNVGEEGLKLNVEGNTHLKGGIIQSRASKEKNHFSTGTLTSENIENYSEVEIKSVSGGASTNMAAMGAMAMGSMASALANKSESDHSTTKSAVGNNINLVVKNGDIPTALSRDAENANQRVNEKSLAELRANQEIANLAGQVGSTLVGDVGKMLKLEDGSAAKVALHGVVGYLSAQMSGGNVAAGAASAMSAEYLNTQVANYLLEQQAQGKLTEEERKLLQQASATSIGGIVGATVGGKNAAAQGALTALNAEKYNRQLHPDEIKWIKANAKRFAQEESQRLGKEVTETQAIERLIIQAQQQVDYAWSLKIGTTDLNAKQFLQSATGHNDVPTFDNQGTFINSAGQRQKLFTTLNNDEYTSLDMYAAEAGAFDKANGNLLTKTLQPKKTNNLYVSAVKNGIDNATKATLFALDNPQQVGKTVAYSLSECVKSGIDCLTETAKEIGGTFSSSFNSVLGRGYDVKDVNYLYGEDMRNEINAIALVKSGAAALEIAPAAKVATVGGKSVVKGVNAAGTEVINKTKEVVENSYRGATYKLDPKQYPYLGNGMFKTPNNSTIINTGQVDLATGNSIYQRVNPDGTLQSNFLMISAEGKQITLNRKPEGLKSNTKTTAPIHHICTDKNCLSTANGGPWTPKFKVFFDNAGLDMQDSLNKIRVEGHQGPHPEKYHRIVYAQLKQATFGLEPNSEQYKKALESTLDKLKIEISTPKTKLNKLVTGEEK